MFIELLIPLVAGTLGTLLSMLSSSGRGPKWLLTALKKVGLEPPPPPPPFEQRVSAAAKALTEASDVVRALETEIRTKLDEVEELKRQHQLLNLDEKQIQAVALELTGAVKQEGRKALYLNLAAGLFFFLAGIGVTLIIT